MEISRDRATMTNNSCRQERTTRGGGGGGGLASGSQTSFTSSCTWKRTLNNACHYLVGTPFQRDNIISLKLFYLSFKFSNLIIINDIPITD